jgi:arabinose-5-phosphate isomerase
MVTLNEGRALELARVVLNQELETIQSLADGLDQTFVNCGRLIADCNGLVWVIGVGTSAAIGQRFAHILSCCGVRSMFLWPDEGLHGHSAVMIPGDLLIALSRGGESSQVNQMVAIANRRGLTTIAFIDNTGSRLARTCQYVLPIHSRQDYELMGYLATTSTVAFSAMCDALCAVVAEARGYTPQELRETHPGGAVGKSLGEEEMQ